MNFPSLRLSPRSFLAGRERQNTGSLLHAEHNCSETCAPPKHLDELLQPAGHRSTSQRLLRKWQNRSADAHIRANVAGVFGRLADVGIRAPEQNGLLNKL
jgi:hypothetical protein